MADFDADQGTPQERILVLGEGRLIDVVRRVLDDAADARAVSHRVVRDVYLIDGTLLAAAALGSDASEAFPYDETIYVTGADGSLAPFAAHVRATRVS